MKRFCGVFGCGLFLAALVGCGSGGPGKISFAAFDKKPCSVATASELATAVETQYEKWGLKPTDKPFADGQSCTYPVTGDVKSGGGAVTVHHLRAKFASGQLRSCEEGTANGREVGLGDDACEDGLAYVYVRVGSEYLMVSADLVRPGLGAPDKTFTPLSHAVAKYLMTRLKV